MSEIYFTSDTHYGHAKIIKYSERPFSDLDHMHEELIRRWNSVVGRNDFVYHLGDFAFGSKAFISRIRARLNGKVHLVLGNHDRSATSMKECGFEVRKVESVPVRIGGALAHFHLEHKPVVPNSWLPGSGLQVCGHVHELWRTLRNTHINVGVDQWDYTPVHLDQVVALAQQLRSWA